MKVRMVLGRMRISEEGGEIASMGKSLSRSTAKEMRRTSASWEGQSNFSAIVEATSWKREGWAGWGRGEDLSRGGGRGVAALDKSSQAGRRPRGEAEEERGGIFQVGH